MVRQDESLLSQQFLPSKIRDTLSSSNAGDASEHGAWIS
jgi:hypothetical protein